MKKVIILEESDYNLVIHSLNAAKDVLKRMNQTKNVRRVAYHIDGAIGYLTAEDSSVRDMKNRITDLESQTED